MIRAVSLHGVTLAWSLEGLAHDPLASVLAIESACHHGAASGPKPRRPLGACCDGAASGPETASPDVTFELRSAPEITARDPREEGFVPSFFHGVVQAYRRGDTFLLWDRASRISLEGSLVIVDFAPPDREVTKGSLGAMLEIAIALSLRRHALFHMHAAALSLPSGEPLIVVGGSGSGKTTTTLSLLETGASYLGDDALFLAERPLRAAAFTRIFHLGPATLAAFPRLAELAGPAYGHHDKRPIDPRIAYPDRRLDTLPLDARTLAIFPSVTGEATTHVEPLARAEAFGLLLASSAALVIDGLAGRDENLAILSSLLHASRCFELRLGRDALLDPSVVASKLAERAAP